VSVLQAQSVNVHRAQDTALTDRELVEQALADPTAFLAIFERYRDPVHRYCHRRLNTREAAEDATQTVFLRAFEHLATCKDRSGFRSWLFVIAHNVVIDAWRRSKPVHSLDTASEIQDLQRSPEDEAIAATDHVQIRTLLAQLPEQQRDVVELRLQGFADKEIADILGKSHQAIRATQHRALVHLRTLMGIDPTKEHNNAAQ
jgi:RNA polymerase sigma-70 factor (ECF subfamily)